MFTNRFLFTRFVTKKLLIFNAITRLSLQFSLILTIIIIFIFQLLTKTL